MKYLTEPTTYDRLQLTCFMQHPLLHNNSRLLHNTEGEDLFQAFHLLDNLAQHSLPQTTANPSIPSMPARQYPGKRHHPPLIAPASRSNNPSIACAARDSARLG